MSKCMTPEQARKYLERYADEEIPDRIAHRALETLAADQIQYRVEYEARMTEKYNAEQDKWVRCDGYWKQRQTGWVDRLEADRLLGIYSKEPRPGFIPQSRNARLVARRVSAPWAVTDE